MQPAGLGPAGGFPITRADTSCRDGVSPPFARGPSGEHHITAGPQRGISGVRVSPLQLPVLLRPEYMFQEWWSSRGVGVEGIPTSQIWEQVRGKCVPPERDPKFGKFVRLMANVMDEVSLECPPECLEVGQ